MQEERQCQGWAAEDRLAEVVEDTGGQAVEDRPAEVEGVYLSCPLNLNRSYSRNMISILL